MIDLVDEACTFETLKEVLNIERVNVAIMGGHGSPTVLTGFQQQVVLKACENDEVMSGLISHFLSCSTGAELGPSMVDKKMIWYIGYATDFQFMVNTNFTVDKDPYAEPFKDVTVTIIAKILEGAKLRDVWDAGIAKCNEWIQKLWGRPETDWAEVISCLQHNRDGMIALGDKEAYVLPPRVQWPAKLTPAQGIVLGLLFLWLTGR